MYESGVSGEFPRRPFNVSVVSDIRRVDADHPRESAGPCSRPALSRDRRIRHQIFGKFRLTLPDLVHDQLRAAGRDFMDLISIKLFAPEAKPGSLPDLGYFLISDGVHVAP